MQDARQNERLAEQAELQAVLSSPIFTRSTSLAQFLSYICNKHFAGEAHVLKEHNIAVEALGRPAEFDQKKSSLVRVEAHRLRKRLREYYATEGADHPVQIDLPPGAYVPVITHRAAPEVKAFEPDVLPLRAQAPRRWVLAACAVLILVLILFMADVFPVAQAG